MLGIETIFIWFDIYAYNNCHMILFNHSYYGNESQYTARNEQFSTLGYPITNHLKFKKCQMISVGLKVIC